MGTPGGLWPEPQEAPALHPSEQGEKAAEAPGWLEWGVSERFFPLTFAPGATPPLTHPYSWL